MESIGTEYSVSAMVRAIELVYGGAAAAHA